MYEIFEQLLQRYGLTTYKVSKETGIPQSTFSSWKTKKNIISYEKAKILADYFNVTVDYLMGNSDQITENEFEAKNKSEREMLLLCRKVTDASDDEKEALINQFKNTVDIYLKAKGLI